MAAPAISNSTKNPTPQDPTKFYYHFLYKAIIVSIFLLILPLLPSQAPNFINQNWELLHLLFAGIAISYGLFSRRSNDVIQTHKEKESSSDVTTHSYVSRFLQMSSLFEDNNNNDSDETKIIQSWNTNYHQYHHHRNEPDQVILEAPKTSRIIEKPLLLPVRSLKSRLSDTLSAQSLDESKSSSVSVDGSVDNSRRFSEDGSETEDDVNVVLPSPIPWRSSLSKSQTFGPSRSDSMASSPSLSSPKEKEESFSSPLVESVGKSQTLRQSRSNSMASSPKGKEESFSSPLEESQGKNAEDVVKKKKKEFQFQKSFPPPPPPPPPPMYFKSISMKPRSKTSMEDPARKTEVSMGFEEDDTESEDDDHHHEDLGGRRLMVNEENSRSDGSGQDVDKKADEFIAKFREQIRLQRIDSIKRSAARISRNSSR